MIAVSRGQVRILIAGAAAVVAASLGATPALAAATWTIKPGGATVARSGRATFEDTKTGASFPCKSVTITATFQSGSRLPGADAGAISAVGFHTCTSPSLVWAMRAGDLPWKVNLSSYHRGVVTGKISHIQIHVAARLPARSSPCSWVIDGTAATASDGVISFRYTDSTGKLTTTGGDLHAYHVSGCAGLVGNGDPFTVSAIFTLSPKQTITSP
jgi:hypothetical protein